MPQRRLEEQGWWSSFWNSITCWFRDTCDDNKDSEVKASTKIEDEEDKGFRNKLRKYKNKFLCWFRACEDSNESSSEEEQSK